MRHSLPQFGVIIRQMNLKPMEMERRAMDVKRFSLEQDYVVDEEGNVESFLTASASFIGYEVMNDLNCALAALSYSKGRFSSPSECGAGRWIGKPEQSHQRVPEMTLGLIFVNVDSATAAADAWTEIKRYSAARITPMIACLVGESERITFVERIQQLSAEHDVPFHFLQLMGEGKRDTGNSNVAESSASTNRTVHFVEAMLANTSYPGLICVDLADVLDMIDGHKNLKIFRISATSFEKLMSSINVAALVNKTRAKIIATLIAPSSLKLSQVNDCVSALKTRLPDDPSMVIAALADGERSDFALYVVLCE